MIDQHDNARRQGLNLRRHGQLALKGLAVILLAAVITLWAWNTLAGDLFAAPIAEFRHAVAAVLALSALAFAWGFGLRLAQRR